MAKRLIRVVRTLIYEGSEDEVKANLKRCNVPLNGVLPISGSSFRIVSRTEMSPSFSATEEREKREEEVEAIFAAASTFSEREKSSIGSVFEDDDEGEDEGKEPASGDAVQPSITSSPSAKPEKVREREVDPSPSPTFKTPTGTTGTGASPGIGPQGAKKNIAS